MDRFDLYDINFQGCSTNTMGTNDKTVTLRAACVPFGSNETKSECASYTRFDRDCDTYTIFAEERLNDGAQLQCYIECSVILHPRATRRPATTTIYLDHFPTDFPFYNSSVKTHPTFFFTFAALLFVLVLSFKRRH